MPSRTNLLSVSRQTLYEQVWTTPLSQLGPLHGMSDNGLRKICKTLEIPLPPRGYWAKLKAGKSVSKPLLCELTPRSPKAKERRPVKPKPLSKRQQELALKEQQRQVFYALVELRKVEALERERLKAIERDKAEAVAAEAARHAELSREAARWRKAEAIRSYVSEILSASIKTEAALQWADWAMAHADSIDPRAKRLEALGSTNSSRGPSSTASED